MVRLFVNCYFSASTNVRTRGVQAEGENRQAGKGSKDNYSAVFRTKRGSECANLRPLSSAQRTLFASLIFDLRFTLPPMFSHVVIFWTNPADTKTADELIAGAKMYLAGIPGIVHFHVGKMAPSHRPVVDQTYQVALNVVFTSKQAQDDYQVHPLHVEFVEKVFKPICKKVLVYDFE